MKDLKLEIRNPNETRSPISEPGFRDSRSLLECGGKRSATPLLLCAERPLPNASRFNTVDCVSRQSAVAARALPAHSKTCRRRLAAFWFLLSVFCFCAQAQFSIDWSTIDGGGGTSTGGVYSVTGTIGQPDAGVMAGGQFTLHGGFWGVIAAVQTPGAPYLTVTRTATNTVVVSWPAPADGWVLEHTNALPLVAVASWPQVPPPYQTNGTNLSFTVTNPPATVHQFFRLHKP